ncbi:MAG: hypothetical protein LKJ86_00470 [Oscillibacter sp.]|jgi:predicted xylose isomerase-like sugar epimerase|nr:hypothetical protein [Oscillibacter sp.]
MKDNDLTPALLEQAKTAPSAAALLALAKENGVELTAEEAMYFFVSLHPETGKLSDEELDSVAGGVNQELIVCPLCGAQLETAHFMGGSLYYDTSKQCPNCGWCEL